MPDLRKKWTIKNLTRFDWDFREITSQASGYEFYCWGYEFARESTKIISQYERELKRHIASGESFPEGVFKEHGVFESTIEWNQGDAEVEDLKLPLGFPDKPFIETDYQNIQPRKPYVGTAVALDLTVNLKGLYARPPGKPFELYLDFNASNKQLKKDFGELLKEIRTHPQRETRGKSEITKCNSELKALAAYRIMQAVGSPKTKRAREFLAKAKVRPFYQKETDWYSAEKTVSKVLNRYFA